MGDLISRQAAIDAICKACSNGDDYVECVERRPESTFCDEIVALRKLPSAEPERKWIPCSERLPEKYGEYQITWKTLYIPEKRFVGDCEYDISGEWDFENGRFKGEWLLQDYMKNYPDVEVLAWCELPEPWRGGEDEAD